jgi:hypothetical protein
MMLTFVPCSRDLITLSRRGLALLILARARSRSSSTGWPPQRCTSCAYAEQSTPSVALSRAAPLAIMKARDQSTDHDQMRP